MSPYISPCHSHPSGSSEWIPLLRAQFPDGMQKESEVQIFKQFPTTFIDYFLDIHRLFLDIFHS
jgi:hypothetical protein